MNAAGYTGYLTNITFPGVLGNTELLYPSLCVLSGSSSTAEGSYDRPGTSFLR